MCVVGLSKKTIILVFPKTIIPNGAVFRSRRGFPIYIRFMPTYLVSPIFLYRLTICLLERVPPPPICVYSVGIEYPARIRVYAPSSPWSAFLVVNFENCKSACGPRGHFIYSAILDVPVLLFLCSSYAIIREIRVFQLRMWASMCAQLEEVGKCDGVVPAWDMESALTIQN